MIMIISLLIAGRVAWVGYGPSADAEDVRAQVKFLARAIDRGAGADMQQLFPEGDFFLSALTASAAAHSDLGLARRLRDQLGSPSMVSTFGSGMVPEHGIFQAGWTLAVSVDIANTTAGHADGVSQGDRVEVERLATVVNSALPTSSSGFLAGYPEQFWPCDTVVAAAALARAAVLLDRPEWLRTVRTWRDRVSRQVDPATGLLPHRVDASGAALDSPRGSSQSIIQAFWPSIALTLDDRPDHDTWSRFTAAFVTREVGLVGVREFPRGTAGAGDVDSGPLILGVSASASVVTLAAARAVGDEAVAQSLNREAELLGLPLGGFGQRRYALGALPVGDAFVAWARSQNPSASQPSTSPTTFWPGLMLVALIPAVLVASGFALHRRRTKVDRP